jgi:hypothetical protein
LLLGAPGSPVTIVIMRGDEQMDVELQRRPASTQVMSTRATANGTQLLSQHRTD